MRKQTVELIEFQSLVGAMRTTEAEYFAVEIDDVFQSLVGAMRTGAAEHPVPGARRTVSIPRRGNEDSDTGEPPLEQRSSFQSLVGAMRTRAPPAMAPTTTSFNPS